jgi:hypothetical protein
MENPERISLCIRNPMQKPHKQTISKPGTKAHVHQLPSANSRRGPPSPGSKAPLQTRFYTPGDEIVIPNEHSMGKGLMDRLRVRLE